MRALQTFVNITQSYDLTRGIMTNKRKQYALSKSPSFKHSKTTSSFLIFKLSHQQAGKTSLTRGESISRISILVVTLHCIIDRPNSTRYLRLLCHKPSKDVRPLLSPTADLKRFKVRVKVMSSRVRLRLAF